MKEAKFLSYPEVILKGVYPQEYTEAIEWAGRQSTATKSKGKSKQFVEARVKEGHLSLGRFVTAQFEVHCSRNTSMQMLRSKFLEFCGESQRYTKQEPHFIVPPGEYIEHTLDAYKIFCRSSYTGYEILLEQGMKKEDARFVLPGSCITSLAVTMNLQAARDFLNLRLDSHAQWEIRTIAVIIGKMLLNSCWSFFFDMQDEIKDAEEDLLKLYESMNWLPVLGGKL